MLVKVYDLKRERPVVIDPDGAFIHQRADGSWEFNSITSDIAVISDVDVERLLALAGGTMYVSPHHVIIDRRMMGTIMNYLAQLRDMNSRWATEADSKPIHDILSDQAVELSRIVAKIEEVLDAQNHSSNR